MYTNSQMSAYEDWMGYGSAFIGAGNINIEVVSFDDNGYVFVDYTYERRTIRAHIPESCIYLQASEFRYEDFAPIPAPEPSNGQVEWNNELIDEDNFPF